MAQKKKGRFSLATLRGRNRAEDQEDEDKTSKDDEEDKTSEDDEEDKTSEDDEEDKTSEDDEEVTEEDEDTEKEAAAFLRGRDAEARRWKGVLNNDVAVGREATALQLLGSTKLLGSTVVDTLSTVGKSSKTESLAERMGGKKRATVQPGGGKGAATDEDASVDRLLSNYTSATGVKPLPR